MKIAHLPNTFLPVIGGVQIVVHNVAQQQQKAGYDVHLISKNTRKKKAVQSLQKHAPYNLWPLVNRTMSFVKHFRKAGIDAGWMLGKQLTYLQKKHNFDVWHLNLIGPMVITAFPYIKKMGVPIVGTCHGIDIQKISGINYGWRLQPDFDEALYDVLSQCDVITAISNTVKEDYESLNLPANKIISVPNGINFNHIHDYPSDKKMLREKLGLPLDKKIIITVGRNHPKKGYKYIPEIIEKMARERQDFLWIMVGKNNDAINELAKEKQVDQYLKIMPIIGVNKKRAEDKFVMPSPDLIALYKASDVFAFPTLIESFGLVNIEAMAASLPVVVTDAPGCRELVTHGYNGLLSPIGDTADMANNILKVLDDDFLRSQLVANGLKEAQKYDWKNIAQEYVQCYRQAIDIYQN